MRKTLAVSVKTSAVHIGRNTPTRRKAIRTSRTAISEIKADTKPALAPRTLSFIRAIVLNANRIAVVDETRG